MWEMLRGLPLLPAVALGTVLDHSGLPLFLLLGMAAEPHFDLGVMAVVLAALAGALAGDLLLYALGRATGRGLLLRNHVARLFGRAPENLLDLVARRPVSALLLYRYVPAVGKYAPLAAGANRLAAKRVVPLLVAGTALYVAVFAIVGWLLQPVFVRELTETRSVWGPVAAAISIAAVLIVGLRFRPRREAESDGDENESSDQ